MISEEDMELLTKITKKYNDNLKCLKDLEEKYKDKENEHD